MARPRTDLQRLTINIPRARLDRCKAYAEEHGITVTQYIQQAMWLREKIADGEFDVVTKDGRAVSIIFAEA